MIFLRKKAGDVFRNTFSFCLLKLAFHGILIGLSAILLTILLSIGFSIGDDVASWLLFVWIIVTLIVFFASKHYLEYILKAGHMAASSDYIKTSMTPDRALPYATFRVRKRLNGVTEYHEICDLISKSNSQIVAYFEKIGFFNKKDSSSAPMLVDIQLGFINSCCLGYLFIHDRTNIYKTAADAIATFGCNYKKLLARANVTAILSIGASALCAIISFILPFVILKSIPATSAAGYSVLISAMFSLMITIALMTSLFAPWMSISIYTTFLKMAQSTAYDAALYGRLCTYSSAFKTLFRRGKESEGYTMQSIPIPKYLRRQDGTVTGEDEYDDNYSDSYFFTDTAIDTSFTAATQSRPVYCHECGSKNIAGSEFCKNCGARF